MVRERVTQSLFSEIEKIAMLSNGMGMIGRAARAAKYTVAGRAAHHIGEYASKGWHSQGGPLWTALGVGATALQVPYAIAKEDSSGLNRSRAERISGLVGDTIGGFAGAGMAFSHFPKSTMLAPAVLGITGSIAGRHLSASPFSSVRKVLQKREPTDESWRNQFPAQSPPSL